VVSNGWIAFLVALLASFGLTWPIRRLAFRMGMVDYPGPRKVHLKPMPMLGGVAIYTAFVLGVVITMRLNTRGEILAILAGATLLALTGILDDSGKLHHQIKLFVSMPLTACILVASGIHAQVFSKLLTGRIGSLLDIGLTILWVVGITASFSILDHMDGLCAGVAAIAAAFFVIAAGLYGQTMVRTLAAASFGAALGFLRWNFSPARIFMGDGGAMLLGFLMATLSLKLRLPPGNSAADWLLPVLILGVPIFDTTLIIISRSRRGLLPFASPGKDHTAHRISNLGLGNKRAVLLIYLFECIFGALGLLVAYLPSRDGYGVAACALLLAVFALFVLEKSPYEHQQKTRSSISVP
jgi:UDP-GlcNAc:undecaprenyl-phosphate/decaprenyl-phosphate GlcNAc-1-phosphate transferase